MVISCYSLKIGLCLQKKKKKRDSIKVMSVDIKWTPDTNNLK